MNTKFPALLALILLASSTATNAALYQAVISGTASTDKYLANPPYSDGDPFTLTLLVNTAGLVDHDPSADTGFYQSGVSNLQLLLDIGGYTGTFGSFYVRTRNNISVQTAYNVYRTMDFFSISMNLDEPGNVFNGLPYATLGFEFYGPASVMLNASLAQSFNFTDFDLPHNISFDSGAAPYGASLQMTTGTYGSAVPIPSTLLLFTPALTGLVAVARRKKK